LSPLPQHLRATLDTLRINTTNEGECRLSMAELASQRGISPRALRRHIRELETLGYLSTRRRPGQPSIYRLTSKGQGLTGVSGIFRRLLRIGLGAPNSAIRNPKLVVSEAEPSEIPNPQSEIPNPKLVLSPVEVSEIRTVGREDILTTLRDNVAKRRPTLLVGPLGIGKSHILRQLVADLEQRSRGGQETRRQGDNETRDNGNRHLVTPSPPHLVYLQHISPIKPALMGLAAQLHDDGTLEVEGIEASYMEWEDVSKKIARFRVNELAELITGCLRNQRYILILDHLEAVTPTMLAHLNALMSAAGPNGFGTVMGAADELKPSAQRLWWAFERIEVPPLSREQTRQLLWQVANRDQVQNPQLFETRVLGQAGGNPLAVITMAAKACIAPLSTQEIRGLQHGAGIRYVPLTPVLMVLGALIVAARFVALGLNDRDLYVLAGLGYAVFFVMRYFIYRID